YQRFFVLSILNVVILGVLPLLVGCHPGELTRQYAKELLGKGVREYRGSLRYPISEKPTCLQTNGLLRPAFLGYEIMVRGKLVISKTDVLPFQNPPALVVWLQNPLQVT